MTALVRPGSYVCEAEANWSRWIARCGVCPWVATPQRFTPYIECPLCGTVTEIIWPTEPFLKAVERLLMMRPNPANRNWLPGESLHDLMFENGAHGVFDNLPEMEPGTAMFGIDDHGIRHDHLPAIKPRIRKALT